MYIGEIKSKHSKRYYLSIITQFIILLILLSVLLVSFLEEVSFSEGIIYFSFSFPLIIVITYSIYLLIKSNPTLIIRNKEILIKGLFQNQVIPIKDISKYDYSNIFKVPMFLSSNKLTGFSFSTIEGVTYEFYDTYNANCSELRKKLAQLTNFTPPQNKNYLDNKLSSFGNNKKISKYIITTLVIILISLLLYFNTNEEIQILVIIFSFGILYTLTLIIIDKLWHSIIIEIKGNKIIYKNLYFSSKVNTIKLDAITCIYIDYIWNKYGYTGFILHIMTKDYNIQTIKSDSIEYKEWNDIFKILSDNDIEIIW